ncbi:MAG: hypothetical protein LBJ98_03350 [Endomicrobium sp.]|jgi:DNA-binding phage protein|nr:hypothetical protein [Endomicrobium sp.]
MKKKDIDKIDNLDWDIATEDFDTTYAKILSKNPERLKAFKKRTIDDYNKTKNVPLFLSNLKIIAMSERKMRELAKVTKIERSSVYKILSREANPSFCTIVSLAHNLGMDFRLSSIRQT